MSYINDVFGRPMFEKQMNPQYEAHARLCKSIGDMAKENEQLKERIKRLESWIASLEVLEQHSGILPEREGFGSEIGYLRKGQSAYKGEAKP